MALNWPPVLTLLGKPDCHLCHEMRVLVLRVLGEGSAASLVEKNIAEDPELERRYLFDIPVLLAGDCEVARHRVSETELRERLTGLGLATLSPCPPRESPGTR